MITTTSSEYSNQTLIMRITISWKIDCCNWRYTFCLIVCQKKRKSCLLLAIFTEEFSTDSNQYLENISMIMTTMKNYSSNSTISKKKFTVCLMRLMRRWLLCITFSILSNKLLPSITLLNLKSIHNSSIEMTNSWWWCINADWKTT